jgi:hypothetical protein
MRFEYVIIHMVTIHEVEFNLFLLDLNMFGCKEFLCEKRIFYINTKFARNFYGKNAYSF